MFVRWPLLSVLRLRLFGRAAHVVWATAYVVGTRVLMDVSKIGLAGSVGGFGWDGASSTYLWVDPKEALYGLMMLQHGPNAYYPIHQRFKPLTYQTLVQ